MSTTDKDTLRRECRARRDTLDGREARSTRICARISELPLYREAQTLHCYLPVRSEVDTRPLVTHALMQGKRVVVPIVQRGTRELGHSWLLSADTEEVEQGVFGTLQPRVLRPAVPGDWELTIVPLLGFDRRGYRLGYGKGYYDRLLAIAPTPTIGTAFAIQEVAHIPNDQHDIPLNQIVTEQEIISSSRSGS
jgi:5-formyltetrahydrofolate cyclo-ligase